MSELDPNVTYLGSVEFPGYMGGSDGSIWSCRAMGSRPHLTDRWRLRKGTPTATYGHLCLPFYKAGRKYQRSAHRFILELFVGFAPPGLEACHNDGNSQNNAITNLRWDTPAANGVDRIRHGRQPRMERHHFSKLTRENVLEIRRLAALGVFQRVIAEQFHTTQPNVGLIVRRERWKYI